MSNLDFYHDDPVDLKQPKSKKRISGVLTLVAALIGGTFYIQTTLAANISLNSGSVEFGQGILQTVACSGSQSLTITPIASFANASGAGSYKFSGIRVDNIPTSCQDTDFSFSAYNNVAASAAQAIFNTSSTRAVVYMTSTNTFEVGTGGTGLSVTTNSASSFTLSFTTPVAPSSDVNKLTVESAAHTAVVQTYSIGQTGPGGGKIFYVASTPFACGPTRSATCTYLEAAPALWNAGASEPIRTWAQATPIRYDDVTVNNANSPQTASATEIGWGYRNTGAIILQGNSNIATSAAALTDSYSVTVSGVIYDDWYLPSKDELNQMCKWQRGVAWTSDATVCTGGTLNSATYGASSAGFVGNYYWSSSQYLASSSWGQTFGNGGQANVGKGGTSYVRPVRAF